MEPVQAGWRVVVGSYPFFVSLEQAPQAFWNLEAQVLPHAPAWMAGLALIGGEATGVVDVGRFLGVARASKGPWLQPVDRLGRAWVLQVQSLFPVVGPVSFSREVSSEAASQPNEASYATAPEPLHEEGMPSTAMGASGLGPGGLSDRMRPRFSCESASWLEPDGQAMQADVLNLEELLQHPRIREFQS